MRKRLKPAILFIGLAITATVITLSLTPHYSCACASKEIMAKRDGSWLTYIVRQLH
jgi:hypothetical protein